MYALNNNHYQPQFQMAYTAKTNRITELLLNYQEELFAIPKDILLQLSQIKVK